MQRMTAIINITLSKHATQYCNDLVHQLALQHTQLHQLLRSY